MNSKTADLQTIQTLAIEIGEAASDVEESGDISESLVSFLEQSMALVLEALRASQEEDGPMVTYLKECNRKGLKSLQELREQGIDIAPDEILYQEDAAIESAIKHCKPSLRRQMQLTFSVGMRAGAMNQLRWKARPKDNVVSFPEGAA